MISTSTPQGDLLYRFVVIADTHVNESEEYASSFFELNRLANGRAAIAFAAAARLKPAFAIHLGDIVHPLPCSPAYNEAARRYKQLAQAFNCDVHLTPGNHDIGDKRWPLAPVAGIEQDFISDYERVFGPQWTEWRSGPCSFFSLNTSLLNSGLPDEAAQRHWFEARLAACQPGMRKFLALHYPPYLRDAHEPGHYDNVDEPARTWLLETIARHRFEAVFCGHVHNFWYDRHDGTEIYLLPSTAFVRQDYSELQRATPPGAEGGRHDLGKLGYFLVDVYETGHIARFMRCDKSDVRSIDHELHATSPHPKRPALPNLGIDLAYPWAEDVELPPNPALDEFRRKKVRNDYPLLSLFELGTSLVRVPVDDLDDDALVTRLEKLGHIGLRVQLIVSSGMPSERQIARMQALRPMLDAVEWVLHEDAMERAAAPIAAVMRQIGDTPLLVSKLRRPSDSAIDGLKYGHLVFHGWVPQEADRIAQALRHTFAGVPGAGAVLRVRLGESPLGMACQADELSQAVNAPMCLVVRMATDSPATEQASELVLAARTIEAAIAAWRYPRLKLIIDGLIDVDRGYFRRLGLIDRAFNPRAAARALRHLQVLLADLPGSDAEVLRHESAAAVRYEISTSHGMLKLALEAADATAPHTTPSGATVYSLLDGCRLDPIGAERVPADALRALAFRFPAP
ncbi:MAG: metallophosphoesterase [Burkholderiaceae bacterium]|nr:metallophosphoesterase [Burkholderiaceae bacterium]